jgi:C-terminal processing protease CtpA/Prc
MMATIVPLLPDGPVFGFQDVHGSIDMVDLRGQTLVHDADRERSLLPEPYATTIQSPGIAVLTDATTGSAAEITAMAFKGLPTARFFGDDSAGLTTGNVVLPLFDGSLLALAVAYEVDRTGTVYEAGMQPDEYVESFAQSYLLDEDPVILAAISWLQAETCLTRCSSPGRT